MGDSSVHDAAGSQHLAGDRHQQSSQPDSTAFHTQLDYLGQSQSQTLAQQQQPVNLYGHMAFDMAAMGAALPANVQGSMTGLPQQYVGDMGQMLLQGYHNPHQPGYQQIPRQSTYPTQPPQQYTHPQYGAGHPSVNTLSPQPSFPLQTQIPYSPIDPYGYGYAPFSPIDPRFGNQASFALPGGVAPDLSSFMRRASVDNSPVPNFPRGPPRKPKQSGHALWVGNLPPGARVTDLKDHFSRDATDDIESVFLIAKSSCAFVNYSTEAACVAAMHRFHDSRLHNVRLVCRLRRGTTSTPAPPATDDTNDGPPSAETVASTKDDSDEPQSPTIARTPLEQASHSAVEGSGHIESGGKVQDRFFIVKSLTAQDLEASVRNGIWATQSHNEETLNKAFEAVENVFLIFSANKSGEYFGYARMASLISGDPVNLSSVGNESPYPTSDATSPTNSIAVGSPQSIPTPATATAPRGRIIDDSARGTIFWEADRADTADEGSTSTSQDAGQNAWGRQFQIEWKSTSRLPFYRTRGLRNPWNANREVKIARDGTELEPSVGRRLISMFNRAAVADGSVAPGSAGPGIVSGSHPQQK